ncbi:MAG: hypothetical protein A3H44_13610 [Gammaproteobacteria bacterium RIFCSPLOWO2_02_FULL_57_10]|nr:MAG: hypothetical protein A3H44_13610 [Gammaproteobacteria bacterium RIFCSPLOWO2_02_FULL_57_10]
MFWQALQLSKPFQADINYCGRIRIALDIEFALQTLGVRNQAGFGGPYSFKHIDIITGFQTGTGVQAASQAENAEQE